MTVKKTIKCTYYGMREVIDIDFRQKAKTEIEKVVREYDSIEFLFYICADTYYLFLMEVLAAKSKYPEKEILIKRVLGINDEDGSEENTMGIYLKARFNESVPHSMFDDVIYAPRYTGKALENQSAFIRRFQFIQNWLLDQCDYIFSYEYPELFSTEAINLKRLYKKGKNILPLISDETSSLILEYIYELEGRERLVLEELMAGKTMAEIAREFKVSNSAIDGSVTKATRRIRERLRRNYIKRSHSEKRDEQKKCALYGVDDRSIQYIYDLFLLIRFMIKELDIREYHVPYDQCFAEIMGPLISKRDGLYTDLTLVAVVPEEDETDSRYYCPPYAKMHCNSSLIEKDFGKNLMGECGYLITNLSFAENKDMLIKFCAEKGITMIDISKIAKHTDLKDKY